LNDVCYPRVASLTSAGLAATHLENSSLWHQQYLQIQIQN